MAFRIFEGRATRAAFDGLRQLALGGNFIHRGQNRRLVTGAALQNSTRENEVGCCPAMAVAIAHIRIIQHNLASLPVHGTR